METPYIKDRKIAKVKQLLASLLVLPRGQAGNDDRGDWGIMGMRLKNSPPYSIEGLILRFLESKTQLRQLWDAYASTGDPHIEKIRGRLVLLGAPKDVFITPTGSH